MPFNPFNMEKLVRITSTSISLNTSGIVNVTVPLRVTRGATANYSPRGVATASGMPANVQVVRTSGSTVEVQFSVGRSGGLAFNDGVAVGSGPGYSGGTLEVVAFGD